MCKAVLKQHGALSSGVSSSGFENIRHKEESAESELNKLEALFIKAVACLIGNLDLNTQAVGESMNHAEPGKGRDVIIFTFKPLS